ncbi:hypothetical protein GCM10010177_21520 [Actinomadura citrea]|nr:hypothetical protein GCM10010177_21520 [Actinomadura citrea]
MPEALPFPGDRLKTGRLISCRRDAMRGALVGLMAGGSMGALWGSTNNFGTWNSAIGAGLMGALAGTWIGLIVAAVRSAWRSRREGRGEL